MRGEADVDRQDAEFAQHRQDALLGRDRQREDDDIDARASCESDEIVDRAELLEAFDKVGRAGVAAIVEHAENPELGRVRRLQAAQHLPAEIATADHHRAALKTSRAGERFDKTGKTKPAGAEECDGQRGPDGEPYAGNGVLGPEDVQPRHEAEHEECPCARHAKERAERAPERWRRVETLGVEGERRRRCAETGDRDVQRVGTIARNDVGDIRDDAGERDRQPLGRGHQAGQDHCRIDGLGRFELKSLQRVGTGSHGLKGDGRLAPDTAEIGLDEHRHRPNARRAAAAGFWRESARRAGQRARRGSPTAPRPSSN